MGILRAWLIAFGITQCVEIPILQHSLRPRRLPVRLALAALASTITHPFVFFAFPAVVRPWELYLVVAEGFAVAVETLFLRYLGVERAFWWALLANASSVFAGAAYRIVF